MKKRLEAARATAEKPLGSSDAGDRATELTWRYAWINVADAIAYLGLGSRSALQRLIVEHRLPHGRRGGKYVFRRADLDTWVLGNQLTEKRSA